MEATAPRKQNQELQTLSALDVFATLAGGTIQSAAEIEA